MIFIFIINLLLRGRDWLIYQTGKALCVKRVLVLDVLVDGTDFGVKVRQKSIIFKSRTTITAFGGQLSKTAPGFW